MASGHRGSIIDSVHRLFGTGVVAALSEAQLLERFIRRGDEAAFGAILLRHGPMVLGVCRRVLDDPHDVDDAFQATFLILVKRARSIRDRDVLGTWLHGVARRVAVRARVDARRRRARERNGAEGAGVDVQDRRADRAEADELRSVIDGELERLPERYRAAVILCDLEGQTHEQAAEQLGCPVGTVKSRLARGRERLRSRLARRGVAPSAALVAATLAAGRAAAVPVELMALTIGAATELAAGHAAAAGACSAEVAALMKGATRSMALSKLKLAAVATLAVAFAVAGTWRFARQAPAQTARIGREEAAGIGEILAAWERRSSQIRALSARFTRTDHAAITHRDREYAGEVIWKDSGRAVLDSEEVGSKDRPRSRERILWTGREIWHYTGETRQIMVFRLEQLDDYQRFRGAVKDSLIGRLFKHQLDDIFYDFGIPEDFPPLPFLVGLKSGAARRRFTFDLLPSPDPKHHLIRAVPRERALKESYSQVLILLDKERSLPDALTYMMGRNGKDTRRYTFLDLRLNPTIEDAKFAPERIKGWELTYPLD
jgi:TIGR03009 family protein